MKLNARDHLVERHRPAPYRPLAETVRHFIVAIDQATGEVVCDCGYRSETATDHERHASTDQRERARAAKREAYWQGVA